jgi:hypothetical protein
VTQRTRARLRDAGVHRLDRHRRGHSWITTLAAIAAKTTDATTFA